MRHVGSLGLFIVLACGLMLGGSRRPAGVLHILACISCLLVHTGSAYAAKISATPLSGSAESALVTVEGQLLSSDIEEFRNATSLLSKAVVSFASDGGSVVAGIEIGKLIRLKNYSTLVPDNARCASACALAWLGGGRRFMGTKAQIGFHADDGLFVRRGANGEALTGFVAREPERL